MFSSIPSATSLRTRRGSMATPRRCSRTSRSSPALSTTFLAFIGDSNLVIHNADFDMRFVNAELARLGLAAIGMDRVVDTLALARKKHPGQPNSLDALCDRYRIDRSRRVRHGALLDAEILVEVYCELMGGRQRSLMLDDAADARGRRRDPRSGSLRAEAAKAILARAGGGGRPRALHRNLYRGCDLVALSGAARLTRAVPRKNQAVCCCCWPPAAASRCR